MSRHDTRSRDHDALQLMTLDTYFCHIFRVVGTGNALVMCSLALLVCEVQPCGNFWMFLAMLRRKSGKDRGVRGVACKPWPVSRSQFCLKAVTFLAVDRIC